MKVCFGADNMVRDPDSVLTVGTFDGIHLGHQFVLEKLTTRAMQQGVSSTLVTFEPHPRTVIPSTNAQHGFKLLTTIDEKLALLESQNLDRVVVLEFTPAFSEIRASIFIETILYERVGFREILVGYDHAFGKNREGSVRTCKEAAAKLHFSVKELGEFKDDYMHLSSSTIRNYLQQGRLSDANRALGRKYTVSGTVVSGDKRGRCLGFPTANLSVEPAEKLLPGKGIYAVEVTLGSRNLSGMLNIGVRPTFGENQALTAEVHLFNFSEEIYGEKLTIHVAEKIRDEMKFASPDELRNQLHEDKKKSIHILTRKKQEA